MRNVTHVILKRVTHWRALHLVGFGNRAAHMLSLMQTAFNPANRILEAHTR